ncbi:MAG: arginine deiminase-related protein [Planctomycetota bacterium]
MARSQVYVNHGVMDGLPETPLCPESSQCASRVLMVRPGSFGRNEAAAQSNAFMRLPEVGEPAIASRAREEFDRLADAIASAGVEVIIDDEPDLPDSVFPNNWMSFHDPVVSSPVLITYPMATPLRRDERRPAVMERIRSMARPGLRHIELEHLEARGEIVEGTGALVLDRVRGVAFACRSPRATDAALDAWERATGFRVVRFDAADAQGEPIYHTNVMMSVGSRIAVVVPGVVAGRRGEAAFADAVEALGKRIIRLSAEQMNEMCANVLELRSVSGDAVIAMSSRAWEGFTRGQRSELQGVAKVVHVPIPTIERIGGGSVRCMIAELGSSSL